MIQLQSVIVLIGKVWNKAVDLARLVNPEQVVQLEEEWGDSLVENKQMDAAISHFIEAGCTRKALDAAVAARQWKKAMHIIQVIDDPQSVAKYYEMIAKHFASVQVRLKNLNASKIKMFVLRIMGQPKKCTQLVECTKKLLKCMVKRVIGIKHSS